MADDLPEYVQRNRTEWDKWAADFAAWAPRAWAVDAPSWGNCSIPEAEVGALPASVAGMDAIELGCGTAYVSAWLAKRGAKPVGIDNSPKQLETARRMQEQFGIDFRSTSATPRTCHLRTPASILRSASMEPRSGAIPTNGFPRRRGCFGRAGGWCSWSMACWSRFVPRRTIPSTCPLASASSGHCS